VPAAGTLTPLPERERRSQDRLHERLAEPVYGKLEKRPWGQQPVKLPAAGNLAPVPKGQKKSQDRLYNRLAEHFTLAHLKALRRPPRPGASQSRVAPES
jgi:hypothetical protein